VVCESLRLCANPNAALHQSGVEPLLAYRVALPVLFISPLMASLPPEEQIEDARRKWRISRNTLRKIGRNLISPPRSAK
jgi:hypothetical protein